MENYSCNNYKTYDVKKLLKGKYESIYNLNLSSNDLDEIPKQNLFNLTNLNLNCNVIEEFKIEQFPNLLVLFMRNNNIKNINDTKCHKNLLALDLTGNSLEELPVNLNEIFPRLMYLNVDENNIKNLVNVVFPESLCFFSSEFNN